MNATQHRYMAFKTDVSRTKLIYVIDLFSNLYSRSKFCPKKKTQMFVSRKMRIQKYIFTKSVTEVVFPTELAVI